MKKSDCLLVIDAPSNKSIFFPSKLADYIGSNRPIFGISPKGTTRRILNELGYYCFDTDEYDKISKGLINMINNSYVATNIGEYDIENNIKKLKNFL